MSAVGEETEDGGADTLALRELGRAVRSRRVELGLTLNNVAEGTGLSVPFLSQVETSFASPSLTSLFSIARILDTSPERLLGGPVPGEIVVTRADSGQLYNVTDAERTAHRRQLTGLVEPFSAAEYVVEPGSDLGGFYSSSGREMIHMTSGRLAIDIENDDGHVETIELAARDSIFYSTGARHRWRHLGRSAARFLLVVADG